MNAALLMMTSTLMAGADAVPIAPAAPPAVVAPGGCGPGGCGGGYSVGPVVGGGCCDSCADAGRGGLLARFHGRAGGKHHKGDDCCAAPAPTCCAPPAPAPACDTCGHAPRPNLFDKVKGRMGKHHKGNDCCGAPAGGGCDAGCGAPGWAAPYTPGYGAPAAPGGVPAVPITPAAPGDVPREMPRPNPGGTNPETIPAKPSPNPGGTTTPETIPAKPNPPPGPGAVVIPQAPVTPVSGPKPTGTTSPY